MKGQFSINNAPFAPLTHLNINPAYVRNISMIHFKSEIPCPLEEAYLRNMIAHELIDLIKETTPSIVGREIEIGQLDSTVKKVLNYDEKTIIKFK